MPVEMRIAGRALARATRVHGRKDRMARRCRRQKAAYVGVG